MKMSALEYFIAVAEAGSITAAAQKLHVTQPSLTKSLQSMEQEIGAQLLSRSSAGVRVTEVGERVLSDARQMVEMYHGWKEYASMNTLRQVNIHSHISLAGFLLPDIIFRFREKHPEISVDFYNDAYPERYASASVQNPALILDICSTDAQIHGVLAPLGNQRQVLTKGAYGILVSTDSALADRTSVTFSDLMPYYLVLPSYVQKDHDGETPVTTAISQFLPRLAETITAEHIIDVGAVSSVIDLVGQRPETFAISYAPAHHRYLGVRQGRLRHILLDEPGVAGELSLIYSARAFRVHPEVRELVEEIGAAASQFLTYLPVE
jgi:DNA-binding transcriptional LysR family regulator